MKLEKGAKRICRGREGKIFSMKKQILNAFQFRHVCKEFDSDRKIPREDFDFILETARLSPSSFGFEPWKFIILQNQEIRKKLLPITWGGQRQIPTASHFVIVLSRTKHDLLPKSDYIMHIMGSVKRYQATFSMASWKDIRFFLNPILN
jgi:nitroreductase